MKKAATLLIVLAFAMVILVSISSRIRIARADEGYVVDRVDHTVEVMYNGCIFINDTIQLTGQAPSYFLIGFPHYYAPHVLKSIAYNGSTFFSVTLDVSLENHVDFYGVNVTAREGAALPQVFTVGFILSNALIAQDANNVSQYTMDFPAYPSLTTDANMCNVSIVVPGQADFVGGTNVSGFNYGQKNLQKFTHSPANLMFVVSDDMIQIVDVVSLKREIQVSEFGEIRGADTYEIVNRGHKEVNYFEVFLPPNATRYAAKDEFGRPFPSGFGKLIDRITNRLFLNLTLGVGQDLSTRFTVTYYLPSDFLAGEGKDSYSLNFSLFENEDYYVDQATVSFVLPEGARILSNEGNADNIYNIGRNAFQETLTVNRQGIMSLDSFNVGLTYEYSPLWLSLRPTVWVWALAIVGCVAVAVAMKVPKGEVRVPVIAGTVRLLPEQLKSFIDEYEEKNKIVLELESLEARVQKGKIPRERYKVRRKTLEIRLNTLSRSLSVAKEKMRAAGGQYLDFMRQLEMAGVEISEAEAHIKSIEIRHNGGELSLEAYRKLLADYQHRKQNAETTTKGILLRLREEIR